MGKTITHVQVLWQKVKNTITETSKEELEYMPKRQQKEGVAVSRHIKSYGRKTPVQDQKQRKCSYSQTL